MAYRATPVLARGVKSARAPPVKFFHGTRLPLVTGSTISPEPSSEVVDAVLDAGRPAEAGRRSAAVSAATSVVDATAIAAIRSYSPGKTSSWTDPYAGFHVYQVELEPFHVAPIAILKELLDRMTSGAPVAALVREYWQPKEPWLLNELLAPSLIVVGELAPSSERDTYLRRWVHYNQDCERARSL
jgi:hypothetical protein